MSLGLGLRSPAFLGALGTRVIPLFDDFNRPDSSDLGVTSVGEADWQELSGGWSISNNRIVNTSGSNPVAVVNARTPDVDIELDVGATSSSYGRDALVFRCLDANNWLRLSRYTNRSSTTSCSSVFFRDRFCGGDANFAVSECGSCPDCPSYVDPLDWGNCQVSSEECDENCSTSTTTRRRIYLHKMENGTLSTLDFWTVSSSDATRLRIRAVGDELRIYGASGSLLSVRTETFNMTQTLHGVGRSTLGNRTSSAIDNFDLALVE